jgi:hypothetical protein
MDHAIVKTKLRTMGFDVEDVAGYATIFRYEGLTYLSLWEDDDDAFFRLALPKFYDVMDDNRASILDIVNTVNLRIKYAKTCIENNSVWAYYEHFVTRETDLEAVIEHAIRVLQATLFEFHRAIDGDGSDGDDEDVKQKGYDDLEDVVEGERIVLDDDLSDIEDLEQ